MTSLKDLVVTFQARVPVRPLNNALYNSSSFNRYSQNKDCLFGANPTLFDGYVNLLYIWSIGMDKCTRHKYIAGTVNARKDGGMKTVVVTPHDCQEFRSR